MKRIYLKAIVLAVLLCLGGVTAFGQETLTKPPKPQKQTETAKPTPSKKTQQATLSTQQTQSASRPSNGYINGHEYVDLGLSVKWATCNVGASSPSDYGNYYAWGETRTKSNYTADNSTTYNKSMGDIAGNSNYDAARANWGGTWRLPTAAEIQELIDNCTTEWTTRNGVKGRLVKSKKNGNSIFLPAAGYRIGTSLRNAGEWGLYWSSSPNESDSQYAYELYFYSGYFLRDWRYRNLGQGVRPVSE